MSTDALELALALHQAPIQRFALRDRPLPDSIGAALQLASATQPQLGDAAALFSESEEVVLEAVRFYLHQVLFEPGTDAYRILGLTPDAHTSQIRQHYLWLQRWLHPDRRGEDWEAVFATKVNWAWQQLRNPASRDAYDRNHRGDAPGEVAAGTDMGPISMPAWSIGPAPRAPRHRLRSIGIGALVVVCVGLFYLAATRDDSVDTDPPALQSPDSTTSIAAFSAGPDRAPDAFPAPLEIQPRAASVDGESTPTIQQTANDASPESEREVVSFRTDGGISARAMPQEIGPSATGSGVTAAGGPALARVRPFATTPHGAADESPAAGVNTESGRARREVIDPSTTTARRAPGNDAAGTAEVSAQPTQAAVAGEDSIDDQAAGAASDAASDPARHVPAGPNDDTLSRFELARERLSSMVSYLRGADSEAPAWDDVAGRLSLEREHQALHARNRHVDIERFALDPPTWRVSDAAVTVEATYHVDARRGVAESGRFHLDMAWRDGGWKIIRFKVSPSP